MAYFIVIVRVHRLEVYFIHTINAVVYVDSHTVGREMDVGKEYKSVRISHHWFNILIPMPTMAPQIMIKSPNSSLTEQATIILQAASQLERGLRDYGLPQPTLEAGGRKNWHDCSQHTSVLQARSALIDASQTMLQLALGPSDYLNDLLMAGRQKIDVLQTLDTLQVAQAVPMDRAVAVSQLAEKLGLNENFLQRQLSFAYLMGLFRESPSKKGHIAHTALSSMLPEASPFVQLRAIPALTNGTVKVPEALRVRGDSAVKVPAQLADPQGRIFWRVLEEEYPPGQGMAMFSAGMKASMTLNLGASFAPYLNGLDWGSIGGSRTVVDVGGGNGHVEAILLPNLPPDINFVIQDLPSNEGPAKALIDQQLANGRITFQPHDFFKPQPTDFDFGQPAVYMLSRVLLDWQDEDCVRILRNLLPAMESHGTKLWVCEGVVPDDIGQIPNYMEMQIRGLDLLMFNLFGAAERTVEQWKTLFLKADERLRVVDIKQPLNSLLSFFEVVLDVGADRLRAT